MSEVSDALAELSVSVDALVRAADAAAVPVDVGPTLATIAGIKQAVDAETQKLTPPPPTP